MATGSASMRSLARKLQDVPDRTATELARWAVPRAESIGGTVKQNGRPVQLSARVQTRRRGLCTIAGTPAWGWSLKSHGRRGGYVVRPRRAEALRLPGGRFAEEVTIRRATRGDGRWDGLAREVIARHSVTVDRLCAEAVV